MDEPRACHPVHFHIGARYPFHCFLLRIEPSSDIETSTAFPRFESYRRINQPRPEERALARVSKDGHKRDRASGHPSRRRTASRLQPTCALDVPISGKPEIGAPPQDEVCEFKLHPPIRLVSRNRSARACGGVIPAL